MGGGDVVTPWTLIAIVAPVLLAGILAYLWPERSPAAPPRPQAHHVQLLGRQDPYDWARDTPRQTNAEPKEKETWH